ncbi:hypothetical protein B0T24DRAFT_598307 [Lasiosphaeria ovina]|uniref:Uncharacterized protein n=1 Tax=Lasiosphaeria ovina TaxID=92902 RepID=A0AAE0JVD6_9PEZI|nr:hypothetical protein B0T24DRAFT_598307 [Lasiosphaeria ovina]
MPDWPAAELLLRLLMAMMIKLVEGDKTGVPAKNMALELLGIIGAIISRLRGHARTTSALDARNADDLGMFLSDLTATALELKSRREHMIAWSGPYRAILEYLDTRRPPERLQPLFQRQWSEGSSRLIDNLKMKMKFSTSASRSDKADLCLLATLEAMGPPRTERASQRQYLRGLASKSEGIELQVLYLVPQSIPPAPRTTLTKFIDGKGVQLMSDY